MCLASRKKMRDGHYEFGVGAFWKWLRDGCPRREDCAPTPPSSPRASLSKSSTQHIGKRDSISDMAAFRDLNRAASMQDDEKRFGGGRDFWSTAAEAGPSSAARSGGAAQ